MTATHTDTTSTGCTESETNHYYCADCHPDADIAFCGTDISRDDFVTEEEVDCVVCLDLDYCPRPDCEGDDE